MFIFDTILGLGCNMVVLYNVVCKNSTAITFNTNVKDAQGILNARDFQK